MQIGIIGGSGFLGKNLTLHLLRNTDWQIKIVTHSDKRFFIPDEYRERVNFIIADVLDSASITVALKDLEVVYYFVHMMGQKSGNFYELELQAANTFKAAIEESSVQRLVYMGGLGSDSDHLSQHLASRHRTGKILRSLDIEVIEFQASMIIAKGSVGFDIITNLVDKLPIMLLPNSATTLTQPIILEDALNYLLQAATIKIISNEIIQIGGPEVLSYKNIYKKYARLSSKHRLVLRAPFIPAWLEAKFLDEFTPTIHARIGKAMVESLNNEMVVTSDKARQIFPSIIPTAIDSTLKKLS